MTFSVNGSTIVDTNRNASFASANVSISAGHVYSNASAFQGTVAGYASGGVGSIENEIDKFPFATNSNASDVGDLTVGRSYVAGQSSKVSGYTSGGKSAGAPSPLQRFIIDKFPFAADGNATDVGDLTVGRYGVAGQSSTISGYTSGGFSPYFNTIDKFTFAINSNASDVGDLTVGRYGVAGQSSTESGYTSGGGSGSVLNVIDKFPFATDSNATDVGDLTVGRYQSTAGQSSTVSGYTSAGYVSLPTLTYYNVIDKFPFASNANATDVGDLTVARQRPAGQSSTVSGYASGGSPGGNVIDKFSFATDGNATNVGNLTVSRYSAAGQQY
jgi:hypothetical protein